MPTSPALAEGLAEPILRLYLDAELILLQKVARRIGRGLGSPSWAEQKLLEVQTLRREAEARLSELADEGRTAVEEAIRLAYNRGVAAALTDLHRAKVPPPTGLGPALTSESTLQALMVEAVHRVQSTHWRILRATTDAYQEVVARASSQVILGVLTRREAAQKALNAFLGRGISGFTDRSGRSWDLASYTEMAVRTSTGNAAILGHVGSLQAAGEDLVIISTAGGSCPLCRPWEGRTLSISGASSDYPSLASARGAGLFHASCRHTADLMVGGLTRPPPQLPAGNAQLYEQTQEQRYMERQIRNWKRREVLALDPETKARARAKVRTWQRNIREHVAANDLRRLPYREQITAAR